MKLAKIYKRVDELRKFASEFPTEHAICSAMERELWAEVLHDFAMGKGTPAKAAAATETETIQFNR